jgi:hypothetical protein
VAQLTIRVGAAVDRSLTEAFRPLIEAANRAKAVVEKTSVSAGAARVRAAKGAVSAEEKEYAKLVKATEKWRRDEVRAAEKAAKDRETAAEKASKREAALFERAAREKARANERAMAQMARDSERAAKQNAAFNATISKGVSAAARGAGGLAKAGLGAAMGIAGDLARGAGVETSFGAMVSKNFELESKAQDLANAGFMAGDARNGMRVDRNDLVKQAFSVGKTTGMDANDAIEGLGQFVGKTGDLATGRDILEQMAKLSRATGTNLSDMTSAAGDVATALGDIPNKGQAINQIMSSFAAQGKLGAVEIKDLSAQMAKLASQAPQFEGNMADNLAMLGALAQEARQRGGAASATQAATSVSSFVSMLKTPKRAEEFEKATGKKVFNQQGMIRNPQELILEALRAKGMDPTGFKTIFANAQGGRAVEGFASIYRQAGGGQAGEKAVIAEFERLKKATIDMAEAEESFRLAMQPAKTQAEVFNQTMRETAMKVQQEVTPALIAMAPAAVAAAQGLAKAVEFFTGKSAIGSQIQSTGGNVANVIAASRAGVKAGEVDKGQEAMNQRAIGDAQKLVDAARADTAKVKSENQVTGGDKAMAVLLDTFFGQSSRVIGKAVDGGDESIGQRMLGKKKEAVMDAESRQAASEAILKQILDANIQLKEALTSGQVKVKTDGPAAGPPGTSDSGRQPPPGG